MKKRIILICSLASSLAYSQVGIKTPNPTNTLDVNGTARIRQVDSGLEEKALTPLYTDANNVVVKIPSTGNHTVTTNFVIIAAGGTGQLISNLAPGAYKVTVVVGNGCVNTSTTDFIVHSYFNNKAPSTNYFGLNAQGGFVTRSTTSNYKPTLTQVAQNNVSVAWSGIEACEDGGNSTALNYNLVINGSAISIVNNGNVAKAYRINATRLD
ncbi:hypothetical protein [Chryseobacterium culicis]|uniref:Uncharacterized protein n=1 Tax=Chryseobacterium culicis TaxID=680127 RepID=A0A1H6HDB5_CHRCI|nr:hypothetical protein [Chryseobacterium culicis]SEH33092.1 hypothetical protein SAMN05421593_2129 [Chryseobacterium culicis]